MPNDFPCPNTPPDCECLPFPVRNFSVEEPDTPRVFCTVTVAARTGTSFASPCTRECDPPLPPNTTDEFECSVDSESYLCAQAAAQTCQNDDPNPPNVYDQTYLNSEQTCTVECPDGTEFSWTVRSGVIASAWQADANSRAYALACKLAYHNRICFTTASPLTPVCANEEMSQLIDVEGGTVPYVMTIDSGTIPPGTEFNPEGNLFGTPTTAGTYTFVVRVTDDIGSFQLKQFTIRVVGITTASPLPDAVLGTPYNQALAAAGTEGTVLWSLVSGSLPVGLEMSSAGVISGTPEASGVSNFRVGILDGGGASCQKDFQITTTVVAALIGYWTYDSYTTIAFTDYLLDSTANDHDLTILNPYTVVPGKVGNCMSTFENTCEDFSANFSQFNNVGSTGFTVCGWIKFDFDQVGTIEIWRASWVGYSLDLFFDTNSLWFQGSGLEAIAPYPADGAWHFYRAWLSPDGILRLQIDNGIIYASPVDTYADTAANTFRLQGPTTAIPDTENSFDETGFWKRPLTNFEAANIWNGGSGITWGSPNLPP